MITPLLLLMLGTVNQAQASPSKLKVVFLSHARLSDEQVAVLEKPTEAEIRLASAKEKLIVEKIGSAITIRDENFFDMDRFDKQLKAIQFLTEQTRQGRKQFRMKDLSPEVRENVVSLLIQGMVDYQLGPKLNDDSATFGLNASIGIELETAGKRSLHWFDALPSDGRMPSDRMEITEGSRKNYIEKERPKLRPKVDVTQVQFRFASGWVVSSGERMELAAEVSSIFAQRLKAQKEAYEKVRQTIVDVFLPQGVSEGMKASGLPPGVIEALTADMTDAQKTRFSRLIEAGTVAKVYGHIRVQGRYTVDGRNTGFSMVPSNIVRGG
jgi:hypothetical protein